VLELTEKLTPSRLLSITNEVSLLELSVQVEITYLVVVVLTVLTRLEGLFGTAGARLGRLATVITYTPTAPNSPSSLVSTVSTTTTKYVISTWTDNSNNETSFVIERSLDGVNFSVNSSTTANLTTSFDFSVATGTTYYYRVKAVNSGGSSGYSNTTTVVIP
jgi:hypothetical protein